MVKELDSLFSSSAKRMRRSAIRELLKLVQKPDIISFAGGLPAPETFPVEEMKEIVVKMLDEEGRHAMQYGSTEGEPKLRELRVTRSKDLSLGLRTWLSPPRRNRR